LEKKGSDGDLLGLFSYNRREAADCAGRRQEIIPSGTKVPALQKRRETSTTRSRRRKKKPTASKK